MFYLLIFMIREYAIFLLKLLWDGPVHLLSRMVGGTHVVGWSFHWGILLRVNWQEEAEGVLLGLYGKSCAGCI